jgi:hypothetical protein
MECPALIQSELKRHLAPVLIKPEPISSSVVVQKFSSPSPRDLQENF